MKYEMRLVGERIRNTRNQKGYSQDDLLDALSQKDVKLGRNTLSDIENGVMKKLRLDVLCALCELFDCEMGYLLCEYDEAKTRDMSFICEMTGLTEDSVVRLEELKDREERTNILSFIGDIINFRENYLIAKEYYELEKDLQKFRDRKKEYEKESEKCVAIDMSKEEFYRLLNSHVQDSVMKVTMSINHFLNKKTALDE